MRPMFVFLSAKLCGELNEATYTAASLVEILHTATLVHDDVVDDSYQRRGFFSINALWKNKIAVLVGDFLLSKGLLLSIENDQFQLLHILSNTIREMSEGELLQLEKVAGLSAADAKTQMLENIKVQSHTEGLTLAKIIVEEAKLSATREAKRIVLQTIQRTAAETAIDNTVTSFPLESDDAKGRIIGREGRNIKAFEAATGVEILI
ncbi:MAG: hypothetical protein RLZZ04_4922, partial [Cyanobacteriota bacterium]